MSTLDELEIYFEQLSLESLIKWIKEFQEIKEDEEVCGDQYRSIGLAILLELAKEVEERQVTEKTKRDARKGKISGDSVFGALDIFLASYTKHTATITIMGIQERNEELLNLGRKAHDQLAKFMHSLPPRESWQGLK